MKRLKDEVLVCLDCETTGLDTEQDRIIEVAVVRFKGKEILESWESLIDPEREIPEESIKIHNITQEMCEGQPKIGQCLENILTMIRGKVLVGHNIQFDIEMLAKAADRLQLTHNLREKTYIDTLRLARLYGESPTNSLAMLRSHFNIEAQGAHRAMGDVLVNVEVFCHLSQKFSTLEKLLDRLSRPIEMRAMPLGKHKGRSFREIPIEYLKWASFQDFDQDLLFSLKQEIKRRQKGNTFHQSPFEAL